MNYTAQYLRESIQITQQLDSQAIERLLGLLIQVRTECGRIFFLGVGGGAGHASHAVNDFRKIAGVECYAPTDNVSELTARINDDGWESSYSNWLGSSKLRRGDCLFVFSVGGGSIEPPVSLNLVEAMQYAKQAGARLVGVVGRDGGALARLADACVVLPTGDPTLVTPQAEGLQALAWHLIVSHPRLAAAVAKWEGLTTSGTSPE